MKKVNIKTKIAKTRTIVIIGEEIDDPDIKAIYLINEAISISSKRLVRSNFEFVLNSKRWKKKYNLTIK